MTAFLMKSVSRHSFRKIRAVILAASMIAAGLAAERNPLFTTDFSSGANEWIVNGGTFAVEGGVFRSRATTEPNRLSRTVVGNRDWRDYRIVARMKLEQAANNRADFGLVARYQDPANYYVFLYKVAAKKVTIETKIKNKLRTVAEASLELDPRLWHEFQVEAVGTELTVSVNGKVVTRASDGEFATGPAGLLAFWADVQCKSFEVVATAMR